MWYCGSVRRAPKPGRFSVIGVLAAILLRCEGAGGLVNGDAGFWVGFTSAGDKEEAAVWAT